MDGEAQYVAGKSEQVDGPPQVGQRVSGMFGVHLRASVRRVQVLEIYSNSLILLP